MLNLINIEAYEYIKIILQTLRFLILIETTILIWKETNLNFSSSI